jgi:hypothetical protein
VIAIRRCQARENKTNATKASALSPVADAIDMNMCSSTNVSPFSRRMAEQSGLEGPLNALKEAGATVSIVSSAKDFLVEISPKALYSL